MKKNPFITTLMRPPVVAGLVAGATILVNSAVSPAAAPPRDLSEARQTTTVLANALVAAVADISDATPPDSSVEDIQANSVAVGLIVPGCQNNYRLVDASGGPLDVDNLPKGAFEVSAVMELLGGAPLVQEVVGGHLRTLVPLTNDFHPNCVTCHTNYASLPPGTVIGAASFRVRL